MTIIRIDAYLHEDHSMDITVTCDADIAWLRARGVGAKYCCLGKHRLPSDERRKVYPFFSEMWMQKVSGIIQAREELDSDV